VAIGSFGVVDYANTSAGSVTGVTAGGSVGGMGVVEGNNVTTVTYITTEASILLVCENDDSLITE
jgi:hypothetical protein